MNQRDKNISSGHGKSPDLAFRERLGALRNLPEFFRLIWNCNRLLAVLNIFLRIIRASLPLTMLYVGKLIIDEIVMISVTAGGSAVENPDMSILTSFILIEL